jgi:dTDP-4-amino-4,6-dideoxygalactose transaminase
MSDQIHLFQNDRNWKQIGDEVLELASQSYLRGQAQNGDITLLLEHTLATKFNRLYCITTGSGTDALHLALLALNLEPNSSVAVSNYTFTASAHAIARAGHRVVPVDVLDNYCIDPTQIQNCKAVVPVDLFGNMSKYAELEALGIPIVVDAAQSLESYNGKWSAEYGIASCVSFSPSKTISSWGSGGAILTDNAELAATCRKLRLHGKRTNDDAAIHPGLNSMMSSLECASVLVGFRYADNWRQRREDIAKYLISESRYPSTMDTLNKHTYSKLVFQTDNKINTIDQFKQQEIDCVTHYRRLINTEPLYHTQGNFNKSRELSNRSFTVPNQHTLTDTEVERIAKALR